jgi:hypothetical protein
MWCASDEEINWVQNEEFGERMDKIKAETQPLLFTGDIGDTIFVRCSQIPAVACFLCALKGGTVKLDAPAHAIDDHCSRLSLCNDYWYRIGIAVACSTCAFIWRELREQRSRGSNNGFSTLLAELAVGMDGSDRNG